MLLASLCLLVWASPLTPAQLGPPGTTVMLGRAVNASEIPELRTAAEPVVLLSLEAGLDMERIGGLLGLAGKRTQSFSLGAKDRARSDERELIEALRSAGTIALFDGKLEGWYRALWPNGSGSGAVEALAAAHRRGALVVARGEATSLVSAASAWDGQFEREEPHRRPSSPPHDQRGQTQLAWNLGFQPWALTDTEARAGGSAWDLIDLLVEERLRLGVYLEEDAALISDPAKDELRVRGRGAAWFFDLRNARRRPGSLQGARFSLLFEGDTWVRRGRQPHSTGRELALDTRSVEADGGQLLTSLDEGGELFRPIPGSGGGWRQVAFDAIAGPDGTATFVQRGWRAPGRAAQVTLTPDEDSTVWVRGDRQGSLANLRLDLSWDPPEATR